MSGKQYHFSLRISAADYLRYYQGGAQSVIVNTQQGLKVKFPASALRPYVTKDGVRGQFVLLTDEYNKMLELRRL
jgi:hypothetical protein